MSVIDTPRWRKPLTEGKSATEDTTVVSLDGHVVTDDR